jgi:16S rRNA (uracil1498-N3)-methyltransferase
MQTYYAPPSSITGKSVYVDGAEAKHILKVVRQGVGDEVRFTDGEGRFLTTRIDRCSSTDLHAQIESVEVDPRERDAPWLTLGLSLLKGDHFELAVEKAVELGVHAIVPLLAERCVVKWKPSGAERKIERWQRIADNAMKQSGRSWRPTIHPPCRVDELETVLDAGVHLVVGDEEESQVAVADLPGSDRPCAGLIGPEGAFSPAEKKVLATAAASAVRLSAYRLRSETAAVVLMAQLAARRRRRHD